MVNQAFRNFGASLALFALISPVFAQQKTERRPSQAKPKTSSAAAKKPVAHPAARQRPGWILRRKRRISMPQ